MEDFLLGIKEEDDIYTEIVKKNLNDRRIIINTGIGDDLLEMVCMYILQWNREDKQNGIPVDKRKPIWIILNSPGGDKISGMMLLDTINSSITPVKCVIMSLAASMASYIPMVSSTTYAFPASVICLHDGEVGVVQTTRKASDTMNFIKACDEKLDDIVLNNTKITEDYLNDIADREYYIFADQGKELGIVDYIIGLDCDLDEIL